MKKITILSLLLLGACSVKVVEETQKTEVAVSDRDFVACLTDEATARIQDGSAQASPVRITVKKMLNACVDKQEQTPEVKQQAQNILTSLMK